MSVEKRTQGFLGSSGPFLAQVTNHLDTTYMGNLEVALIKAIPNSIYNKGATFQVRYLSPFYGVTSSLYEGNNKGSFNDVQKSYGMWMVPPDVGTTVMIIFVDGNPQEGYWIGCVPDLYQNHMVPGIAASRKSELTPDQKRRFGTDYLPVAEFLKSATKSGTDILNPNLINKPVHPFADRLLAQGLLLDTVRGTTSSSARREIPSQVFGISTPGPVDKNGPKGRSGYSNEGRQLTKPISRLGGSTFVMDDGDITGQNELVRIRTRTGHQILMHNSHDLIYIANGNGTAWIELTSDGKIDIYAKDSVSIRTENDFNFRADRDINFEAGRDINMRSVENMNINVDANLNQTVVGTAALSFKKSKDETVAEDYKITVSQGNLHLKVAKSMFSDAGQDINAVAGAEVKQRAGADFSVSASGQYKETATKIFMNGPSAARPTSASPATSSSELVIRTLPNKNKDVGWQNNKYSAEPLSTFLKRAPTHEPWDHHENVNKDNFKPDKTDVRA